MRGTGLARIAHNRLTRRYTKLADIGPLADLFASTDALQAQTTTVHVVASRSKASQVSNGCIVPPRRTGIAQITHPNSLTPGGPSKVRAPVQCPRRVSGIRYQYQCNTVADGLAILRPRIRSQSPSLVPILGGMPEPPYSAPLPAMCLLFRRDDAIQFNRLPVRIAFCWNGSARCAVTNGWFVTKTKTRASRNIGLHLDGRLGGSDDIVQTVLTDELRPGGWRPRSTRQSTGITSSGVCFISGA